MGLCNMCESVSACAYYLTMGTKHNEQGHPILRKRGHDDNSVFSVFKCKQVHVCPSVCRSVICKLLLCLCVMPLLAFALLYYNGRPSLASRGWLFGCGLISFFLFIYVDVLYVCFFRSRKCLLILKLKITFKRKQRQAHSHSHTIQLYIQHSMMIMIIMMTIMVMGMQVIK